MDPSETITGVVVLAPEADPFVANPHVTLLAPFRDPGRLDDVLVDELAAYFATVAPFSYTLVAVREFPGGHVYLTPEPAEPFRDLTRAVAKQYPEHPPYGGIFDDIVPHCTIDPARRDAAERALPLRGRATAAHLVVSRNGIFADHATFPFGA